MVNKLGAVVGRVTRCGDTDWMEEPAYAERLLRERGALVPGASCRDALCRAVLCFGAF